jgi:hypothetical protein
MISSEVQRTLVKSPPELWAELSDPAALARHLGELGEIRIVRTEPESKVEWAAENTTGTVSIKPSGWGTKVTLSATCETAAPPAASGERTSESEPAAAAAPPRAQQIEATAQVEPEMNVSAVPEAAAESDAATTPAPGPAAATEPTAATMPATAAEVAAEPEVESRRGFFARLFGRRRRASQAAPEASEATAAAECTAAESVEDAIAEPGLEPPDAFAAVRRALALEAFAEADPFAVAPAVQQLTGPSTVEPGEPGAADDPGRTGQIDELSAELMAAEDVTAEQVSAEDVTAVLTAVLDRLGAAHHRPFSRS